MDHGVLGLVARAPHSFADSAEAQGKMTVPSDSLIENPPQNMGKGRVKKASDTKLEASFTRVEG